MDFTSLNLFGSPLTLFETYFEFEGPRTFALRSEDWSIYYIANAVEESDDGDALTYLLVAVADQRFRAIRSGQVSFRDAFRQARNGTLFSVVWRYSDDEWDATINPVRSDSLSSRWLPSENARLNLRTTTVVAFDRAELRQTSNAQNRTLLAIEVEATGRTITEFPTRRAGELQIAIQAQLDALAAESQGGAYSASRDIQTTVLDLRAASFVLVLGLDKKDTLVERAELVSAVLDRLAELLDAAASETVEVLYEKLTAHNARVRNRFKDLLDPLVQTGSGLTLNTASLGASGVSTTSVSRSAVLFAHDAIANVVPTIRHIDLARATVIGLNVRTTRFELFDNVSATTFQGYMTPGAATQADGMPVSKQSFVTARLRVEWDFDEDAVSGIKYYLENIERIAE